jgi:transcriptional regulator with XRE-family HTH domain
MGRTDLHRDIRAWMTPAENLKSSAPILAHADGLGEKAGISKQQVSAMERGKEPIGRKEAHRLADALGTSYGNLFW